MSEIPELINDLAYILMSAGIVTLIFKRLKQPLVLGLYDRSFAVMCKNHNLGKSNAKSEELFEKLINGDSGEL